MSDQSDSRPIPASLKMASDVERMLREQQVGIYFVMPRVVRRVLQNELDIASPWQPPPHRKICVMSRDRLMWIVARDELGVDERESLPEQIILIAQPDEIQLETMTREELQRHYWRLMYHARIDFKMIARVRRDRMSSAELRRRIDHLGQTAFDEIRSVLRAEQMLLRPEDDRNVYAEFVAVYHELLAFAPRLVPLYFPSLAAPEQVLEVIGPDCDATVLLQETRPIDLPDNVAADTETSGSIAEVAGNVTSSTIAPRRSARRYAILVRTAAKYAAQDNNVHAALVLQPAPDIAPLESVESAKKLLNDEIEKFVCRLQKALELSDAAAKPWLIMCEKLLLGAQRGFWNPNARLLYDLQTVCFDHEHEIYKVDLLRWCISLGKAPLKRPLPNQRIVMMSKHLRSAALRVASVEIDPDGRAELTILLHEAADAAEHILRVRMEPSIERALKESGLVPASVVERVALKKMVRELADSVVDRGFITLGGLRDAISRNQLKMPDLNDSAEFFAGDPLLRADRLLSASLDGVYQRGPFYLRWLQRMNSLAYGIPFGRLLTRFVFLPFGLSFLILMSIEEIGHLLLDRSVSANPSVQVMPIAETTENLNSDTGSETMSEPPSDTPTADAAAENVLTPPTHEVVRELELPHTHHVNRVYSHKAMFLLGCLIFALIHFPGFRWRVLWLLTNTRTLLRILLIDLPRALLRLSLVDRLLRSFPMLLLRRFVLAPLVATFVFWFLCPRIGFYHELNRWWGLAIFMCSFLVLNSRLGRDTEELTREFFARTWYRIRDHLLFGLFTLIVDVFGALMDGLERVLYAVDEWLRFRSGESNLTLGIKAVGGLIWSFVHGVIRFCVTLLIEPQVNPIKHFPVVTVSHKLVLTTLTYPTVTILQRFFDKPTAYTITGLILTSIPGAFGFLAWELKENWKLYKANRSPNLKPVLIGEHGETLYRLLCPGFHSGTIPRLFARQRRAARNDAKTLGVNKQAKFAERLHHETVALRHFFERELIALMDESRTFRNLRLAVDEIELATNQICVIIREASAFERPLRLQFAEQSGWLIVGIADSGWLDDLEPDDVETFKVALTGLYKLAAVDLVREQLERQIASALPRASDSKSPNGKHPYDVGPLGLVVWPDGHYEREFLYPIDDQTVSQPRPRTVARAAGLHSIPMESLVFQKSDLDWDVWRRFWDNEQSLPAHSTARFPFQW